VPNALPTAAAEPLRRTSIRFAEIDDRSSELAAAQSRTRSRRRRSGGAPLNWRFGDRDDALRDPGHRCEPAVKGGVHTTSGCCPSDDARRVPLRHRPHLLGRRPSG
jgi:hypothetical protein